jgi:hypothetical protein
LGLGLEGVATQDSESEHQGADAPALR